MNLDKQNMKPELMHNGMLFHFHSLPQCTHIPRHLRNPAKDNIPKMTHHQNPHYVS